MGSYCFFEERRNKKYVSNEKNNNEILQNEVAMGISNNELRKIYANEYNYINQEKSITNNKNKSFNKNMNKNYDKFDTNKEYYLICPECNKNVLKIQSITYQPYENDFRVTYKCFCKESIPKFLYQIISENNINCKFHQKSYTILCQNCNIILCEDCLTKHEKHKIKSIINNKVISEDIMKSIMEKKDEFKGCKIIQNIYEFYQVDKYNDFIFNHNGTNIFSEDSHASRTFILQ